MADRFDEIGTLFLRHRKELGLARQQLKERIDVTKLNNFDLLVEYITASVVDWIMEDRGYACVSQFGDV